MKIFKKLLSSFFLLFIILNFYFQVISKLYALNSSNDAEFLKINPDPSSVALGEAILPLTDAPSIIEINPAGVIQNTISKLSLNYIFWTENLRYHYLAFTKPLNKGILGASLIYFAHDDINNFIFDIEKSTLPKSKDLALSLFYAIQLKSKIPVIKENTSLGIGIKFLQSKFSEYSSDAIAIDIGSTYKVQFVKGLDIGLIYKNLDSGIKFSKSYNSLPLVFNAGLRYKKPEWKNLLTTLNWNLLKEKSFDYSLGIQMTPLPFLDMRMGYINYKNKVTENFFENGLRAGIGIKLPGITINYTYVPNKNFLSEPMHLFGIELSLGYIKEPEIDSELYLEKHFREAKDNFFTEDYISARNMFENILYIYPGHNLSKNYIEEINEIKEPSKFYEKLITKWLKLADKYYDSGNLILAKKYYDYVLEQDTENLDAKKGIENISNLVKKILQDDIIKQHKKEILKLWKTATRLYNRGRFIEAKDKYKQILIYDPENKDVQKNIMEIEGQLSQLGSQKINETFNIGAQLFVEGKYSEAIKYFEAVLITAPHREDAGRYITLCNEKMNDEIIKKQQETLAKRQQEVKDKFDSTYAEAESLYNQKNLVKSLKQFEEANKLCDEYQFTDFKGKIEDWITLITTELAEEYYKRGYWFYQQNRNDEAINQLKETLKYNPNHVSALALIERINKDILKIHKDLGQKFYNEGMKEYAMGNLEKAKENLRKSLFYDPNKKEAKIALERMNSE